LQWSPSSLASSAPAYLFPPAPCIGCGVLTCACFGLVIYSHMSTPATNTGSWRTLFSLAANAACASAGGRMWQVTITLGRTHSGFRLAKPRPPVQQIYKVQLLRDFEARKSGHDKLQIHRASRLSLSCPQLHPHNSLHAKRPFRRLTSPRCGQLWLMQEPWLKAPRRRGDTRNSL
jgi:hypothetical protein